jgi:hypothetical protein
MTDALRTQTQIRLEADLVNRNESQWHRWTTSDADFVHPMNPGFAAVQPQYRQLAVVKKNKHVLERLYKKLCNTDGAILRDLPVMIIDDECDQASVNSSKYSDEMTAINGLIRKILQKIPRAAYIGYTATPFANVLIDPSISVDENKPDDLYPRDFIVSLPRPEEYFGAEQLFGRDLLDADEVLPSEQGLDMINTVDDEEIKYLRPARRIDKDVFQPEMTGSLEKAVRYFILATAARCARGDSDQHSSMLVHTTVYISPHFAAQLVIRGYVQQLLARIKSHDDSLRRELEEQWEDEHWRIDSSMFALVPVKFSELSDYLEETAESIEFAVENGESEERLDFTKRVDDEGRRFGRRYIVVGGSVIGRGLTIEGLIVSYFVRSSSQYDTLMQMGRWFGYRPKYQDLPRIWMPVDLSDAFRSLAMVEAEIRYDIDIYEREELTPLEFAVRIRQIPGMAITAKNKMLNSEDCAVSFSNEHIQTRKFKHMDGGWLKNNWQAGATLVNRSLEYGCKQENTARGPLIKDVPVKMILSFLKEYRIHGDHEEMNVDRITDYIKSQNEKTSGVMSLWNVGIIEPKDGRQCIYDLGSLGKVKTVVRSRFKLTRDGDADIKALMSKADILIDLPGQQTVQGDGWAELKERRIQDDSGSAAPLVLLYPIEAESQPKNIKVRKPLDAVSDVLGLAIVFPRATKDTPVKYKRVVLPDTEYEEPELPEEEATENE